MRSSNSSLFLSASSGVSTCSNVPDRSSKTMGTFVGRIPHSSVTVDLSARLAS